MRLFLSCSFNFGLLSWLKRAFARGMPSYLHSPAHPAHDLLLQEVDIDSGIASGEVTQLVLDFGLRIAGDDLRHRGAFVEHIVETTRFDPHLNTSRPLTPVNTPHPATAGQLVINI